MKSAAAARVLLVGGLAVGAAGLPGRAHAQASCGDGETTSGAAAANWTPPLGRTISLHERDLSLREALDRLAASAHIRVSYSADLLPLERRVCVAAESQAVGRVLAELLRGTHVRAVATGGDHVVLAPDRVAESARPQPPTPTPVISLDPLLVDGQVTPVQRAVAIDVDVVDGRQLERQAAVTLAQALNGAVPGVWLWQTTPSSMTAHYGSVRGASSFGFSSPKVYIDGIEVANPLLLTRISPESIERIELIRGPEGAALYGADAISGVTNIITRHAAVGEDGATRGRVSTRIGLSQTDYAQGAALGQEHSAIVRLGSSMRSAVLNLSVGSAGELVPGAFARHATADGSLRIVAGHALVTGTLRFSGERASTGVSPLLPDSPGAPPNQPAFNTTALSDDPRSLTQYTVGVKAMITPNAQWTHSVVLGVDGYRLDGLDRAWTPFLTPADSALLAAGAAALRGTLRLSTATNLEFGRFATSTVTLAAEHSLLEQQQVLQQMQQGAVLPQLPGGRNTLPLPTSEPGQNSSWQVATGGVQAPAQPATAARSRSNTGLSAHLNTTMLGHVLVSGGMRIEQSGGSGIGTGVAALPMLGGAVTGEAGPFDFKVRTAWGRSIRWPELPGHRTVWTGLHAASTLDLGPERQDGIEAGIDVALGRALSLQLTRFDQTASGLVQRTGSSVPEPDGVIGSGKVLYGIANVGVITNRGWEMQASAQRGPASLAGTLSLVDSRVRQLAEGYGGDLRPGDRMLAVPARIASLTAGWTARDWSASLSAARAADWINYDRLALANALLDETTPQQPAGEELREFWRTYDGVTHLRAAFTRDVRTGITLSFSADNLLNQQVGEPDNITVLPGRTFSLGLRAAF